jgi:predicted DNA-binding transcriptional regulator YafY
MTSKQLDRHVLIRVIQIDKQIRDGLYPNASTLAKKFELSARTLQRDIEALRDFLGANIQYDPVKKGYFYPPGTTEILPGLKLNDDERFILFLSENILPTIHPEMKKTFQKLLDKMFIADKIIIDESNITSQVSFDLGKSLKKSNKNILLKIKEAIIAKRTLKINYYTAWSKQINERLLDPYHIHYSYANWIVIGYCHLRKKIRSFSLGNIKNISLTKDRFVLPDDFSYEKYIGNAWGIIKGEPVFIKLRFSEDISEWISQRQWHKTQKMNFEDNGCLILSMKIDGITEILSWILGWGAKVEVLEPTELRQKVQGIAEKICKLYSE